MHRAAMGADRAVSRERSGAPRRDVAAGAGRPGSRDLREVELVRVSAFAKINLALPVLGARRAGYHELRTTFQTLALHDTLTFSASRGPFEIVCDDPA